MRLAGLSAVDYATLSDSALDQSYIDALNARDNSALVAATDEIIRRLATPGSAIEALFGHNKFPKYAAITKFNGTDAIRSSVADSAGNLADKAKSVLTSGAWIVGGVGLLALLLRFRSK